MSSPRCEMPVAPSSASARDTAFCYRLHGLTLESDHPIAGLTAGDGRAPDLYPTTEAPVRVHFARWPLGDRYASDRRAEPDYRSPFPDGTGQPRVLGWPTASGRCSWFVRSDGLEFVIDRRGHEVWIE